MIYEIAGRLRLDPRPFTWRQLDDMDWALRVEQWEHSSALMATIMNSQKSKGQAIPLDKFNKYAKALTATTRGRSERQPFEIEPHLRYL